MSNVSPSVESNSFIDTIKTKVTQVRESRAFKPVLIAVAIGLGTYYGAKQPMKQIAHDVHDMADRSKRLDHNFYTFANQQMNATDAEVAYRVASRNAIHDAVAEGRPFEYFPDLGVLFPEDIEPAKAKKG